LTFDSYSDIYLKQLNISVSYPRQYWHKQIVSLRDPYHTSSLVSEF